MTLDQYALCPGGLDKKIKFCCKDLINDLGKIYRAIEGEQLEAAAQLAARSLKAHPDRQCLHALYCQTLLFAKRASDAEAALGDFLQLAPENPIALALSICLELPTQMSSEPPQDLLLQQVRHLHTALAASPKPIPELLRRATELVGRRLIRAGHLLAGREHLAWASQAQEHGDEDLLRDLARFNRLVDISPLLKESLAPLPKPVDWVQWKEQYISARELAERGGWSQAADQLRDLIERHESHPVLLKAHAMLRCRLPDPEAAHAALTSLAECESVSQDESVEAYALAQLLSPRLPDPAPEKVAVVYEVADGAAMDERLLSAAGLAPYDRYHNLEGDEDEENRPQPKTVRLLLDRDPPAVWTGVTFETVPHVLCEVAFFGRETDREARLQLVTMRGQLAAAEQRLRECLGDCANLLSRTSEQVLQRFDASVTDASAAPYLASAAPKEVRDSVSRGALRNLLLKVWPHQPHAELDHLTPQVAATIPRLRRRLLAALLNLQFRLTLDSAPALINELYDLLQLPHPESILVGGTGPKAQGPIPLVRLGRVDPTRLPLEDLMRLLARAVQYGLVHPALSLGHRLLEHEDLGKNERVLVLMNLATATPDTESKLHYLQAAETAAIKAGTSPAEIMLSEFRLRAVLGHQQRAEELLERLRTQYINQPGIAEGLIGALQQLERIADDSRRPSTTAEPGSDSQAPAENAEKTVWTPDTAGTAAGATKSQIWVPGMD